MYNILTIVINTLLYTSEFHSMRVVNVLTVTTTKWYTLIVNQAMIFIASDWFEDILPLNSI